MRKKKVVFIGGAGFIGHNLAIELRKNGAEPYVIDNLLINNILSFAKANIKDRKLYVYLRSSVIRNELFMLQEEILKKLNETAGEVLVKEIILK